MITSNIDTVKALPPKNLFAILIKIIYYLKKGGDL